MAEQKAECLFHKYEKQLIKKLGKKGLYNDTIDKLGAELFGIRWRGCHPSDQVVLKNGYQIINVDTSKKSGSHWIGIFQTPKNIYVYDSFARPTSKLMKQLTKNLNNKGIRIHDSDLSDVEQRGASEVCGQLSLSWLLCVRDLGIKSAMLI